MKFNEKIDNDIVTNIFECIDYLKQYILDNKDNDKTVEFTQNCILIMQDRLSNITIEIQ